jgi:hypothetical protein
MLTSASRMVRKARSPPSCLLVCPNSSLRGTSFTTSGPVASKHSAQVLFCAAHTRHNLSSPSWSAYSRILNSRLNHKPLQNVIVVLALKGRLTRPLKLLNRIFTDRHREFGTLFIATTGTCVVAAGPREKRQGCWRLCITHVASGNFAPKDGEGVGSNSSFDHRLRNAHIAKDKSAKKRREQICQSSASRSLDL